MSAAGRVTLGSQAQVYALCALQGHISIQKVCSPYAWSFSIYCTITPILGFIYIKFMVLVICCWLLQEPQVVLRVPLDCIQTHPVRIPSISADFTCPMQSFVHLPGAVDYYRKTRLAL